MDTIIFQQTFTIDQNGVKDDNVTNIIPCSISSDSDYNNYQPTPAEGEEANSDAFTDSDDTEDPEA